ncbi:MAG: hypothetical protein R6W67_02750 [Bacteroidales bacterium]
MGSDKIRKIQLQVKDDTCCSIYGIVFPEPAYKLCLALNNLLGISLKSDTPVVVDDGKGNKINFARFCDLSEIPLKWTALVSNRYESISLVKKLANIDYLILHFNDSENECDDNEFASSVRKSGVTNGIFNIERALIDKDIFEKLIPLH